MYVGVEVSGFACRFSISFRNFADDGVGEIVLCNYI